VKKKIIIGAILNENFSTHEDYKSWVTNETSSVQTVNGSVQFIGEIGSFGLISEVFRIDIENTYTWFLWVDDKEKQKEMIGEKVIINGISEKDKGNEILLAEGEIQEVTQDELQVPGSDKVVKFVANIKPMREGKWKLKPYLNEKLLGTTVVTVLGK